MLSKTRVLIQQQFTGLLIVTGLLVGLFPSTTLATDLFTTTVPASACQPQFDDVNLVRMNNGAWSFRSGQTGRATLYCPLPIHSSDFPSGDRFVGLIRIYYRDSDALGSQASVTVRLMHRRENTGGIYNTGPLWDSNNVNILPNETGHRTVFHRIERTLGQNRIYFFRVNLERVSTGESPVFTGIDFHPIPPG